MTEITRMDLLARMPAIMLKYPSILRALKDMRRGQDDRYSMGLLLERHAASCADQAAIVFEEQVLTYREFNERVNRVAHYLAARGLGKGQVVALMMENRPEFLICFCAAMKLGAVTALINSHLKQQGLAHCLNICEPQMFIIGEEVCGRYGGARARAGEHRPVRRVPRPAR
jgi:citronellyl-CoA synthetase